MRAKYVIVPLTPRCRAVQRCRGPRIEGPAALRDAIANAPLPTPGRPKHVKIARNADCYIAIEPLRAPGYAPPIANAPRRELAEPLKPANAGIPWKTNSGADTLLLKATTWSSTLTGSPSPPSRSLTSPSSAPESATLVLSPRPLLVRFLVRGNSRRMWWRWSGWRGDVWERAGKRREGKMRLCEGGDGRMCANMGLATAATNNRSERRDDGLRADRHANRTRGKICS